MKINSASTSTDPKLTSIGHGQHAGASMLELEVFVLEFASVDAFAASAIAVSHVSTLTHETRDDAVESRFPVTETRLTCRRGQ